MNSYILSSANRIYAGLENTFGAVPELGAGGGLPAVRFQARHRVLTPERRDKTGSRTKPARAEGLRRQTSFELAMYMASWTTRHPEDGYLSVIRAALGGEPLYSAGGTAGQGSAGRQLVFEAPHKLEKGQAVSYGSEVRFVTKVSGTSTVEINAPFTLNPTSGAALNPTLTLRLGQELPSVSLFDRWSPEGAVQRIVAGGVIDRFRIRINGDYHLFEFSGPAADLLDSVNFEKGQGGLQGFPIEPERHNDTAYSVVPGHLGQVWFGDDAASIQTLTQADLTIDNGVEMRDREFGSEIPKGAVPGRRDVKLSFDLYQRVDAESRSLYRMARQQKPFPVMFQLGKRSAELCGVYLPSVVPDTPVFDDREPRLGWAFENCQAQGGAEEEVVIGFA